MDLNEIRAQLAAAVRPALVPSKDAGEDARALSAVLAALADASAEVTAQRYAAVLRMRDEGRSLAQIGDELGMARGSAQGLVERALRAAPPTSDV